jgi:hypothetical protein
MIDQRDATFGGGAHATVFARHGKVGDVAIQGFATLRHRVQPLVPIGDLKQWTVMITFEPLQLLRDAGLQPHHVTAFGHVLAVERGQHGTGAGRHQHAAALAALVDGGALALAKAHFALELEHGAHIHAAVALDLLIDINERQSIMHGKASPDGRFAGAGRADNEQVVRRVHG